MTDQKAESPAAHRRNTPASHAPKPPHAANPNPTLTLTGTQHASGRSQALRIRNDDTLNRPATLIAGAFAGRPDAHGVLARLPVQPPDFTDACYYACSQKHDPLGQSNRYWPGGANRMQALRISQLNDVAHGGALLLLQLAPDRHLALVPIAGPATVAYFTSHEQTLHLELATWGTGPIDDELPLLAWGVGSDPCAAVQAAWDEIFKHPQLRLAAQPRESKTYPAMFSYLGWCTWEQYKVNIHETMLLEAIDQLESCGLPIRYALVDDGHLHHTPQRQLLSLAPDADKFPHGWANLLQRRRTDQLRWFGLWLNFNGYWKAIARDNQLGELNEHLADVPTGGRKPAEGFAHAYAFYEAMVGQAGQAGFDFVKVDDQAQGLLQYTGVAQPVKQAVENSQALEAACQFHRQALINCMAHNSVCLFNTRHSAVTRCSEDYKLNDLWRAKAHLHNSFANMLWFGPTVWGDHDMFHANDAMAGQAMAISKAVSGGPIYLSDAPSDFDPDNVWPLCLHDGRLLRPLAPGAPLADSVYRNPFTEAQAYRTIAPLANHAAAIAIFNLTHPAKPVSCTIAADDYRQAPAWMTPRPTWPVPDEGLLLYDWHTATLQRLRAGEQSTAIDLPGGDQLLCRLYLMTPITHGWSVIGRADKFLAPAAATVHQLTDDELVVSTPEPGPLRIWSDRPFNAPAGNATITAEHDQLWRVDVQKADTPVTLRR